MGREVRMVPANWQHPQEPIAHKPGKFRYRPLLEGSYADDLERWRNEELPEWIEGERLWREEGKVKSAADGIGPIATVYDKLRRTQAYRYPPDFVPTHEDWAGQRPEPPSPDDYMPDWTDEQRTHFMMYEDTSEGTPISPAFATAEELARWLADTGASAFAGETATYEQWLSTVRRGQAISAVMTIGGPDHGRTISGVAAGA